MSEGGDETLLSKEFYRRIGVSSQWIALDRGGD